MDKKPPHTVGFDSVVFVPRFEYGDQCQIGAVVTAENGGELGGGFARLTNARIPWTIKYDEVLMCVEGEARVHCGGKVHHLKPKDCLWLPAGTELEYEAESALIFYGIHPVNWAR
jgi:ethanolamine utilization protein EutQ